VRDRPASSLSAEVVTSTVWHAIAKIPGVADLYRNPLQSLGERVHLERHRPVRLADDADGPLLEIHIVLESGASVSGVGEAVARAGADYLAQAAGTSIGHVEVYVDDVADAEAE
jgi:uncharacterized alkaline shock family protein YloU